MLLGQFTSQITYAQNPPEGPGGKPPQAAILACSDIAENMQCSFQGPRGLESGACEHTPDKQYFACNPNRENKLENSATKTSQVKEYPSHLAPDLN